MNAKKARATAKRRLARRHLASMLRGIPRHVREAFCAALDLARLLDRPMHETVKVRWRGRHVRRIEVYGLGPSFFINGFEPDVMDIAVTLQNAGFDDDHSKDAEAPWFWEMP